METLARHARVALDLANGRFAQASTTARSLFPALENPATRHRAVACTPEEFHYAVTTTLGAEDSRAAWQRYAVAAPGYWIWEYGLFAHFKPGHRLGGRRRQGPGLGARAREAAAADRSRRLSPRRSTPRDRDHAEPEPDVPRGDHWGCRSRP